MIKVLLNGENTELHCELLADAMGDWQYSLLHCAVAINGEFIPRSAYGHTTLREGDAIDVVSAIGGG